MFLLGILLSQWQREAPNNKQMIISEVENHVRLFHQFDLEGRIRFVVPLTSSLAFSFSSLTAAMFFFDVALSAVATFFTRLGPAAGRLDSEFERISDDDESFRHRFT